MDTDYLIQHDFKIVVKLTKTGEKLFADSAVDYYDGTDELSKVRMYDANMTGYFQMLIDILLVHIERCKNDCAPDAEAEELLNNIVHMLEERFLS